MSNLVQRLRDIKHPLTTEAADRIEELEKQYKDQAAYDTTMDMWIAKLELWQSQVRDQALTGKE